MNWSDMMDISKYIIVSAPCGGPIAVLRDDKRILKYQISGVKPIIHIFSQSGKEMSALHWNNGKIICLAWTSLGTENLICVQEDGTILIYDMFGNFKKSLNFAVLLHVNSSKESNTKIIDCRVYYYTDKVTNNKAKLPWMNNLTSTNNYDDSPFTVTKTAMAIFTQTTSPGYQASSQATQNKVYYTLNLEADNVRLEQFFDGAATTTPPSLTLTPMIPCGRSDIQCFIPDDERVPLWHLLLDMNNNAFLLIAREHDGNVCIYDRFGNKQKFFVSIQKEYKCFHDSKLCPDRSKIYFLTDNKILWIGGIKFNDGTHGYPTLFKIAECDPSDKLYEYDIPNVPLQPLMKQYENISLSNNDKNAATLQLNWCGNYAIMILNQSSPHLNLVCWAGGNNNEDVDGKEQKSCSIVSINVECDHDDDFFYAPIPESDGCRILTRYNNNFIHMVPSSLVQIFRIGSVCPAALLLDASQAMFKANDSKRADEYFATLNCCSEQTLANAFLTCLDAASHEFDAKKQKLLLQAVFFGKAMLTKINEVPYDSKFSSYFTRTNQLIRILNSVRHQETSSIPLTFDQYKKFVKTSLTKDTCDIDQPFNLAPLEIILKRLINGRHFALAVEISEYLGNFDKRVSTSKVLSSWACYKAGQFQLSNSELSTIISSKLGPSPDISYSEIAYHALDAGRPELANLLLEFETNLKVKVNLLVKMGNNAEALKQACRTGLSDLHGPSKLANRISSKLILPDPELIFLVFLKMLHMSISKKSLDPLIVDDLFLDIIQEGPTLAKNLFPFFCSYFITTEAKPCVNSNLNIRSIKFLNDYIIQNQLKYCKRMGNYEAIAMTLLKKDMNEASYLQKIEYFNLIQKHFQNSSNEFLSRQTEEQIKLLQIHLKLKEMDIQCKNYSLYETMSLLIQKKQYKMCDELKKDFKVSDKQYWWLKISALAENKDWEELERFSNIKKSPIGYEAFMDVCLKNNDHDQAVKYIQRIGSENKVQYYLKVGLVEKACELAYQQKNIEKLEDILRIYTNDEEKRTIKEKIHIYKMQLKK